MTLEIRSPIKSAANIDRLRSVLRSIRRQYEGGEITSIHHAAVSVTSALKGFFMSLGEPKYKQSLLIKDTPPQSQIYNQTMQDIQDDLTALGNEVNLLHSAQVESFNFTTTVMSELGNRLSEAVSKIVDLNILNGMINQDILVGGDDFLDASLIDSEAPVSSTRADLIPSAGTVILHRVGSENVAENAVSIKVTPIEPAGIVTSPTQENLSRFYEGKFYDYAGRARPEGGRWHFQTLVDESQAAGPTGDVTFRLNKKLTLDELQTALDNVTPAINPEDTIIIDLGATEEEKETIRNQIVDQDPETFWEGEYVIATQSPLIDPDEFLGTTGDLIELNIDPNALRQRALNEDKEDLSLEVMIELESEQFINFITLNPFNFSEQAWIDVQSIEIAEADGSFIPIPGLNAGVFDNVLTDEANEYLNEQEITQTLAPNKFAYKGQGVWSFPMQRAKLIRMVLRQRSPVPNPYHKMSVLLTRVVQKVKTSSSGGGGM